jgi:hypothetical protein
MPAKTIAVDRKTIDQVRALVDSEGLAQTCKKLDLANATVARLAGGLPVSPGMVLLAQERLRGLESHR